MMTYAFIIVVSIAITLKLLFLTFSLYFTVNNNETQDSKVNITNKSKSRSLLISWKQLTQMFLPRTIYCPEAGNKNHININK